MPRKESKKTHDVRNARLNPIRSIAYKLAGGIKAYNDLSPIDRSALRAQATKMLEAPTKGKFFSTDILNVLPFIKRNRKSKPMTKNKIIRIEGEKIPEGFVYAIRNPDLPNILKIGKTYPDGIEDRLSEARRWGRAELVEQRFALDAVGAEKYVHNKLMHLNLRSLGYTNCGVELFECNKQEFNDAFTDYLFVEKDNEAKISKK